MVEYAIATKTLEHKLSILTALNISVDGDGEEKVSFNIIGSNKSMVIDKAKLREAITIQDAPVTEHAAEEVKREEMVSIDATGLDEAGFLQATVKAIGPVTKTPQNSLDKDSFLKVFKYTGEFAKFKNSEMKKTAQASRCQHFNGAADKYLEVLKANI